jgi:hypothetical protein
MGRCFLSNYGAKHHDDDKREHGSHGFVDPSMGNSEYIDIGIFPIKPAKNYMFTATSLQATVHQVLDSYLSRALQAQGLRPAISPIDNYMNRVDRDIFAPPAPRVPEMVHTGLTARVF